MHHHGPRKLVLRGDTPRPTRAWCSGLGQVTVETVTLGSSLRGVLSRSQPHFCNIVASNAQPHAAPHSTDWTACEVTGVLSLGPPSQGARTRGRAATGGTRDLALGRTSVMPCRQQVKCSVRGGFPFRASAGLGPGGRGKASTGSSGWGEGARSSPNCLPSFLSLNMHQNTELEKSHVERSTEKGAERPGGQPCSGAGRLCDQGQAANVSVSPFPVR